MVLPKQCLAAVFSLGLAVCLVCMAGTARAQETDPGEEPDPGAETDPGTGEEEATTGSQTGSDITADWKGIIGERSFEVCTVLLNDS